MAPVFALLACFIHLIRLCFPQKMKRKIGRERSRDRDRKRQRSIEESVDSPSPCINRSFEAIAQFNPIYKMGSKLAPGMSEEETMPGVKTVLSMLIGKEHGKSMHRMNISHCLIPSLIQIG
ncbi:hypothetical protein EI555_014581 [Monodon monoceros]|uniref:Uncharacterized protein n=1 Tax=Monodon monoceros TaxID=40151 RepID=A0A4U1EXG6_MONMO|nr:hypothetical protein EI555_014581 [Monodon monoceros]